MSPLRRHLSPLTQLIFIGFLALFVGVAILVWPVIGKNTADKTEDSRSAQSAAAPSSFRPTKEQWAGFKIADGMVEILEGCHKARRT